MRFHLPASLVTLGATIALASHATAQPLWKPYGNGCLGTNGTPAIGHTGEPVIGNSFQVDLSSAPAGSLAILLTGTSSIPALPVIVLGLNMPGCDLFVSTDLLLGPSFTSAARTASIPLAMPNNPTIVGAELFFQWGVFDQPANGFGMTLSDAACATIGDRLPIQVTAASTNTLTLGGTVTLSAANMDPNPDNTCGRIMWPNGDTALLRFTSIQPGPTGQTVTAKLASLPADPANFGVPGELAVFHGDGGPAPIGSTLILGDPGDVWGWVGEEGLGHMQMTGLNFTLPTPQSSPVTVKWTAMGNNCVKIQLPAAPCPPSPGYPYLSTLLTDIHWNVSCNTNGVKTHYDFFMDEVLVADFFQTGSTPVGFVAGFHELQIADLLNDRYPGVFNVRGNSTTGEIVICLNNPNCIVTSFSGKTIIDC